jgi:hypothetical protein
MDFVINAAKGVPAVCFHHKLENETMKLILHIQAVTKQLYLLLPEDVRCFCASSDFLPLPQQMVGEHKTGNQSSWQVEITSGGTSFTDGDNVKYLDIRSIKQQDSVGIYTIFV